MRVDDDITKKKNFPLHCFTHVEWDAQTKEKIPNTNVPLPDNQGG